MSITLTDPGAPNLEFERPAGRARLERTAAALASRGFVAQIADSAKEARRLVLEAIPDGAEVHVALSETMRELGITAEIDQSGRYDSVRSRLSTLDRATQGRQIAKLGAAPDYIAGSAHAVTDAGERSSSAPARAASSAPTPTPPATSSSSSGTKNSSPTLAKACAASANTACRANTPACKAPAALAACSPRR